MFLITGTINRAAMYIYISTPLSVVPGDHVAVKSQQTWHRCSSNSISYIVPDGSISSVSGNRRSISGFWKVDLSIVLVSNRRINRFVDYQKRFRYIFYCNDVPFDFTPKNSLIFFHYLGSGAFNTYKNTDDRICVRQMS